MKNNIATLIILLAIISCGSNNSEAKQAARDSIQDRAANASPVVNFPDGSTSGAAAAGGTVHHYTCPNNCEGSGGAAQANCPVCGTAYVHNQAFHSQPAATTTGNTITPPASTSPAQNAAGVYHYICNNGCAGGAAAQGNCATCGNALVHNTAYHN